MSPETSGICDSEDDTARYLDRSADHAQDLATSPDILAGLTQNRKIRDDAFGKQMILKSGDLGCATYCILAVAATPSALIPVSGAT